jgi:cysteine desulfurase
MSHPADPIYLDHNATTPLLPDVIEAIVESIRCDFGNPSSGHVYGERARSAMERARGQVAGLLGCSPDELIFTAGGTEANNLAIRGLAEACSDRRRIVTTTIEHPATREPCRYLEARGWKVVWAPVDHTGRARPDEIVAAVTEETTLVTIMHANNEVGTLQPVREIAAHARDRGVWVHTDAAQSVGKVPVRVDELGVDLLSVAGHKLYGPKGVGVLYVRSGTPLRPVLLGAGHERRLRPSTENVASIVGLGVACEIAGKTVETEAVRLRDLRDRLWQQLREAIPEIVLHGDPIERLPNTLNLRFPGVRGSAVLEHTPEVAASTGSACHEGEETPSSVLIAMGMNETEALGAVRLSLGRGTTSHDIDRAGAALVRGWKASRTD